MGFEWPYVILFGNMHLDEQLWVSIFPHMGTNSVFGYLLSRKTRTLALLSLSAFLENIYEDNFQL